MFFLSHEHCLKTRGVMRAEVEAVCETLRAPLADFKRRHHPAAALLQAAHAQEGLEEMLALASEIRLRFADVVILGAGGSGLSGRVLTALAPHASPRLHFMETVDPQAMDALLARLNPESTALLAISKSGQTLETLAQFYALAAWFRARLGPGALAGRAFIITLAGENPLRRSAGEWDLRVLDHPADIGGRFAWITCVGLLPAAIAGLDVAAIRRGAAEVTAAIDAASGPADFLPAFGAALQYSFMRRGCTMSVMLPYGEKLLAFSSWYRQGWAESLGKQGKGTTPLRAIGPTDQHSQLQLYLDGPKDKFFTLIALSHEGAGLKVNAPAELAYLQGKTLGDIMQAEQQATLETMARHGCPLRVVRLETLSEKTLGGLLMHFTCEILLMAELLGVNAFDQPAVEEGKRLAKVYLQAGL